MILRCAVLVSLGAASLVGQAARAGDLTVALPQGPLVRALTDAFATPFQHASGVTVHVAVTDGSIAAAKAARAEVMVADGSTLQDGCKSGALLKLNWTALGGRDRELPGTATDCGEGAALRSIVLAWDHGKFSGQPNWGEFWDVAKAPGKRGLHRGARTTLEIALMADGVAPADVYSTLRGQAGVDRAFRKLDQLKPYVVWWQSPEDAPKLLESAEALMTSAPANGIMAAEHGEDGPSHPGFAVNWNGSLTQVSSWAILPGATPLAMQFLAFAADPKNQRTLATLGGLGGTTLDSTKGLPAATIAQSSASPANLAAGLMLDEQFWQDNGAKLEQQFTAWLAK
jgi:putative spermidine/putrescine transport system substrate-binding protein